MTTTDRRQPVNPFTSRIGNHYIAEWREDGKWWGCIHKHRTEHAAVMCGEGIRKSRTTEPTT